mmetsp:Transcript_118738/g.378662  ORF Transcript_118738/g.378662 Transcript_118738/m.378662 type:complete len:268 (+) Transcript_118738:62-865(+)
MAAKNKGAKGRQDSPREPAHLGDGNAGLYVCVHCAEPALDMYQEVGQEIRLRHCDRCGQTVDHYIEFEILLVFVDLQLLLEPVYRHILHNRFASQPGRLRREAWRFLFVCLMLDAHSNLRLHQGRQQAHAKTLSDLDLVSMLGLLHQSAEVWPALFVSLTEWMAYLLAVSCCGAYLAPRWRAGDASVAISVSSFGKLYSLLALIWGRDRYQHMQWATAVLVMASNVVAVKAMLKDARWGTACAAILAGAAARAVASAAAWYILVPTS